MNVRKQNSYSFKVYKESYEFFAGILETTIKEILNKKSEKIII